MLNTLESICNGIPTDPLPPAKARDESLPHAPIRAAQLSPEEIKLSIRNSLRYFPEQHHQVLAIEFAKELSEYGHIYMYRFIPNLEMRAYSIDDYPAKCQQAAAIMLMIMNNLDKRVAQFPQELVTYGGNGQVFSNWAQFLITMNYLSSMDDEQTLALYSGHPLGLFPSFKLSPRVIISNGNVIANYSKKSDYDRMFKLGVTMYGQMTAGSYCYIGPQGIVHGTTITILNAGRKYLGLNDLRGKVFVTSGLGGMSGAQAKAATICGCVGVIAEVSLEALLKRKSQGWLIEVVDNLDALIARIRIARDEREVTSIGYHGNIVDLWERLAHDYEATHELLVELGSDQTSCHNPFNGGYYPVQLTYEQANIMMLTNPENFKKLCQESLRRQVNAINLLSKAGLHFWDYGNAFLLEADRAGAQVDAKETPYGVQFRYPSYVQHIMGDIFSLGFGPFRWVCTSCDPHDLETTDSIAHHVMKTMLDKEILATEVKDQLRDNIKWIKEAGKNNLVVGSQARILYADKVGRVTIALAFNEAIKSKLIKKPIVISRDHHDVSGADSPFRETSNVYDGSAFTADMTINTVIGDAARGATWVALHNGGGVGWGEVVNCGFGLVLDGTDDAAQRALTMLGWDVSNGVARRAWAGNQYAKQTIERYMKNESKLQVTMASSVQDHVLDSVINNK